VISMDLKDGGTPMEQKGEESDTLGFSGLILHPDQRALQLLV